MATVDELIVRITADTKGLEAGLGKAGAAVNKSVTNINRSITKIDNSVRKVDRSVKVVNNTIITMRNETSRLEGAAGRLRSALQGVAAFAVVRSITKTATEFDSMRRALDAATGSAESGARSFDFIRRNANALGLDLFASTAGFSQLAAAAKGTILEGQAVQDIFSGVSKAAAVMSLSTADTNGVFRALSQVMSKGKVSAEELRGQMGERIPGAFQIASRAMGVSTAQLDKMLSTGQLMSEDFLPRFALQLEKEFGAAAENASTRAAASFARFNNALVELQVSIAQSGLLDFLSKSAEIVAKLMTPAFHLAATAVNAVKTAFAEYLAAATKGLGLIASFFDDDLSNKLTSFSDDLARQADIAATSTVESFKKMKAGVEDFIEPTTKAIEEQAKLEDKTKQLTQVQDQNKVQQKELKDAQKALKTETKEFKDRLREVTEQYNPAETAARKFAEKQEAIEEAFNQGKIDAKGYETALNDLKLEFADNEQAMIDAVNKGLTPYKDAQERVKKATDAITESQNKMKAAIKASSDEMVSDNVILLDQARQLDNVTKKTKQLADAREQLKRLKFFEEGQVDVQDAGEFAVGGGFTVSGTGGTDSQVVQFRATPGERISIETPEQVAQSGGQNVFHVTMNNVPDVAGFVEELEDFSRTRSIRIQIDPIYAVNG